MSLPKIGILTISDRASRGEYEDLSGPAIEEALRDYLATECEYLRVVIPDEQAGIEAARQTPVASNTVVANAAPITET